METEIFSPIFTISHPYEFWFPEKNIFGRVNEYYVPLCRKFGYESFDYPQVTNESIIYAIYNLSYGNEILTLIVIDVIVNGHAKILFNTILMHKWLQSEWLSKILVKLCPEKSVDMVQDVVNYCICTHNVKFLIEYMIKLNVDREKIIECVKKCDYKEMSTYTAYMFVKAILDKN